MERRTHYNLIEPDFNPDNKLLWNQGKLARIAEMAKLEGHITIAEALETDYHPAIERRVLSKSDRDRSDKILGQVFPGCLPSLPLPANAAAAATFFDPISGLSTIKLNHEVIKKRAETVNPKNPDQGYIDLVNGLTRWHLWHAIQADKLHTAGDILSKPLGTLGTLAVNLAINAVGCAFVYGSYRLIEGAISSLDLSLLGKRSDWGTLFVGTLRLGFAGGLFLCTAAAEAAILAATVDPIKDNCQTLRDYIYYASPAEELLGNLAASLTVTGELFLKRPSLVSWK